jgi:hypothetical protein
MKGLVNDFVVNPAMLEKKYKGQYVAKTQLTRRNEQQMAPPLNRTGSQTSEIPTYNALAHPRPENDDKEPLKKQKTKRRGRGAGGNSPKGTKSKRLDGLTEGSKNSRQTDLGKKGKEEYGSDFSQINK